MSCFSSSISTLTGSLQVRINPNGIFAVSSANLVEKHEVEEEVPVEMELDEKKDDKAEGEAVKEAEKPAEVIFRDLDCNVLDRHLPPGGEDGDGDQEGRRQQGGQDGEAEEDRQQDDRLAGQRQGPGTALLRQTSGCCEYLFCSWLLHAPC